MTDENGLDIERLRHDLRAAEQELGPDVEQRLHNARREAVALAQAPDAGDAFAWLRWQRWAAAGAMAAVVLIAVLVTQRPPTALPLADEAELAAAQEIELLEDLEFVAWMVALEDEELPNSG